MTTHTDHQDQNITTVLLTVGNTMMGDDGAGPLLAENMLATPKTGWHVIDGGAIPENAVHQIRALNPQRVIVVDATEMGLPAGEVRIIDPDLIAEMFIMSTHDLPLTFLIDQLKSSISEVIFVGIQPDTVAFYCPLTSIVEDAVERLTETLQRWDNNLTSLPIPTL